MWPRRKNASLRAGMPHDMNPPPFGMNLLNDFRNLKLLVSEKILEGNSKTDYWREVRRSCQKAISCRSSGHDSAISSRNYSTSIWKVKTGS